MVVGVTFYQLMDAANCIESIVRVFFMILLIFTDSDNSFDQ